MHPTCRHRGCSRELILRIAETESSPRNGSAWQAFAKWQQQTADTVGYVSQPAHAALAGRLAGALTGKVFGNLPYEVIESIGRHDSGWAPSDLPALEGAWDKEPASFLACSASEAIGAWRRSIHEAEERSLMAGVLTRRHFVILAPRDRDHEAFIREETRRQEETESPCGLRPDELQRYTAALGFCDLLSLCLCCGMSGTFEIPLAHPADPASADAPHVRLSISEGELSFDRPILHSQSDLYVDGWIRSNSGTISLHRFTWATA